MPHRRIAIIGSGSAGASAALFLHGAGESVQVFERELNPGQVGAGIMLQPTGLQVLDKLGLREKALALGRRIDGIHGNNHKGNSVLRMEFRKVDPNAYGLGIHRGSVFNLLHQELAAKGVPLTLGTTISRIEDRGTEHFLHDEKGKVYGPFDLIVIASGAASHLRDGETITQRSRRQKWAAAWLRFPATGEEPHYIQQVMRGSRQLLGLMPIGHRSDEQVDQINFFWSLKWSEVDKWRAAGREAWLKELRALAPQHEHYFKHIPEDLNSIIVAPYYDAVLRPFHREGVAFIGDVAHATSPQLSSGTNNALLDAQALAEALATQNDLDEALNAFMTTRETHVRFYQWACRWVTPLFQGKARIGPLRDLVFRVMSRWGWAHGLMARTALGIQNGLRGKLAQKYFIFAPWNRPQNPASASSDSAVSASSSPRT